WRADERGDERLLGSTCRSCGATTFPAQQSCPRCASTNVEERLLAARGTLWTWTVQGFAPKSPPFAGVTEDFEPFPVG
ncbi:unnamed protein product, partial [Phaeothamnion confervicola]